MDRVEQLTVGILLMLLGLGISLIALSTPSFTRIVMLRAGGPALSGLNEEVAIETAEKVRGFVTGTTGGSLPETVGDRQGFNEAAVSHLGDVKDVFSVARIATAITAAILAIWISWSIARTRWRQVSATLKAGALLCAILVGISAIMAFTDFDVFFSRFHSIFFEQGTWRFSADDLLIQLFPEEFWVTAGVGWTFLLAAWAALLLWSARSVSRSSETRA